MVDVYAEELVEPIFRLHSIKAFRCLKDVVFPCSPTNLVVLSGKIDLLLTSTSKSNYVNIKDLAV